MSGKGRWYNYWTHVHVIELARASTMKRHCAAYTELETITPSGVVKSKWLVDLGAAAGVIAISGFQRVCKVLRLAPSLSCLRAANGQGMKYQIDRAKIDELIKGRQCATVKGTTS